MSCLLTQQMSCLLTQQMSCLQTQQMFCLQTHETSVRPRQRSRRGFFPAKTCVPLGEKVCFGVGKHVFGPHGRRRAEASGGFSPGEMVSPMEGKVWIIA